MCLWCGWGFAWWIWWMCEWCETTALAPKVKNGPRWDGECGGVGRAATADDSSNFMVIVYRFGCVGTEEAEVQVQVEAGEWEGMERWEGGLTVGGCGI